MTSPGPTVPPFARLDDPDSDVRRSSYAEEAIAREDGLDDELDDVADADTDSLDDNRTTADQVAAFLYESDLGRRQEKWLAEAQRLRLARAKHLASERSGGNLACSWHGDDRAYPDRLASGRHIRLLQFLDFADENERSISCCMETVSLDEAPFFDALSYAWGEPNFDRTIVVNGKLFAVTQGLFDALTTFWRTRALTRWIWIDALCINQADRSEQSHQITLMQELFAKAAIVHIWLGLAADGAQELFNFIKSSYQMRERLSASDSAIGRPDTISSQLPQGGPIVERRLDRIMHALHKLFECPWWHRVWTLQEAALATHPVVHWGQHTLSFALLQNAVADVASFNKFLVVNWYTAFGDRKWQTTGLRENLKFALHFTLAGHVALGYKASDATPRVLAMVRHRSAGRAHDQIYGLLGILPPELDISPDYEIPVEHVYESSTLALLKITKDPGLLHFAGGSCGNGSSMPSWVLDFRNLRDELELFDRDDEKESTNEIGNESFVLQAADPGTLVLRGQLLDKISDCSAPAPCFPAPLAGFDLSSENLSTLRTHICQWLELVQRLGAPEPSFWWSIIGAFIIDGELMSDFGFFLEWLDNGHHDLLEDLYTGIFLCVIERVSSNRCIVTDGKAVGIGAGDIEDGDLIARFAGSRSLFILREANNDKRQYNGRKAYQLIGRCRCQAFQDPQSMHEDDHVRGVDGHLTHDQAFQDLLLV